MTPRIRAEIPSFLACPRVGVGARGGRGAGSQTHFFQPAGPVTTPSKSQPFQPLLCNMLEESQEVTGPVGKTLSLLEAGMGAMTLALDLLFMMSWRRGLSGHPTVSPLC